MDFTGLINLSSHFQSPSETICVVFVGDFFYQKFCKTRVFRLYRKYKKTCNKCQPLFTP